MNWYLVVDREPHEIENIFEKVNICKLRPAARRMHLHLLVSLIVFFSTCALSSTNNNNSSSTLIVFAYHETSPIHKQNLLYFIQHGIPSPNNPYKTHAILVMNGKHSLPPLTMNSLVSNPNVSVLTQPNVCFDFGAWATALNYANTHLTTSTPPFDYFIFLNASVRGPFISPAISKIFDNNSWPGLFTSHIDRNVKLVGTTFNCHTGRHGWHLQSMALATDRVGLESVFSKFLDPSSCFDNKVDAIYGGEIPLSRAYLDEGYELFSLSSLMKRVRVSLDEASVGKVERICTKLRGLTSLQLGDVNHSEEVLVTPHEVIFYKTNIPTSKMIGVMKNVHLAQNENEKENENTCRVAFCFSGAARSFVLPEVHDSIIENLIARLARNCEPYLFFYLDERSDEVMNILDTKFSNIFYHIEVEFHDEASNR